MAEELSKVNHRLTLLAACTGIILGLGGAMSKGPWLVSLASQSLIQNQLSCSPSINEALTVFVEIELAFAVIGGISALLVVFFWRRFFRRRAEAKHGIAG